MFSATFSEPNMTKRASDKIKAGLDDAKAFLEGMADTKLYRINSTPPAPEESFVKR
jgi:hypothetical protein